jgi:hypothetical protein
MLFAAVAVIWARALKRKAAFWHQKNSRVVVIIEKCGLNCEQFEDF